MRFFPFVILLLGVCLVSAPPAFGDSSLFDQQRYMERGARLGDAEEMLRQWLGEHPEDGEARFLVARVLFWQGKHEAALVEYARLLGIEPDNAGYLMGQALALVRSGRARAALPSLARARRLEPDDEGLWRLHIEALQIAGGRRERSQARILLDQAKRRFPHAQWSVEPLSSGSSAGPHVAAAGILMQEGFPLGCRARF